MLRGTELQRRTCEDEISRESPDIFNPKSEARLRQLAASTKEKKYEVKSDSFILLPRRQMSEENSSLEPKRDSKSELPLGSNRNLINGSAISLTAVAEHQQPNGWSTCETPATNSDLHESDSLGSSVDDERMLSIPSQGSHTAKIKKTDVRVSDIKRQRSAHITMQPSSRSIDAAGLVLTDRPKKLIRPGLQSQHRDTPNELPGSPLGSLVPGRKETHNSGKVLNELRDQDGEAPRSLRPDFSWINARVPSSLGPASTCPPGKGVVEGKTDKPKKLIRPGLQL